MSTNGPFNRIKYNNYWTRRLWRLLKLMVQVSWSTISFLYWNFHLNTNVKLINSLLLLIVLWNRKGTFMKSNLLVWVFFLPLFLFFSLMLYIEVSIYSALPPELGGRGFWVEFKNAWYRSIWFYAIVLLFSFLLYLKFLHKGK